MEIIKKTDEKLVFITEMSDSLANAIRRNIGNVPVSAINELEIEKNDSALYDETFAHRVGLVPIKAPKNVKEDSVFELTLNKKGPGYVYSGDINGDCEIVYDNIPLTLLRDGQEIKAKCITKVGHGIDHAKFSPGIMFFRILSNVTLPKKYKEIMAKTFPENTIKEKGDKIVVSDDKVKPITDFCEGLCKRDKEECEVNDTKKVIITVEPFGQINSKDIFKAAILALKKDLKAFEKAL